MAVGTSGADTGGILVMHGLLVLVQIDLHRMTGGAELHFVGEGKEGIDSGERGHAEHEYDHQHNNLHIGHLPHVVGGFISDWR